MRNKNISILLFILFWTKKRKKEKKDFYQKEEFQEEEEEGDQIFRLPLYPPLANCPFDIGINL